MTTDVSPSAVSELLKVLRALPVWMLAGLALAGYAILFAPPFGGVDPVAFRHNWGIWIWMGTLTFSILAVSRGLDAVIVGARHRRAAVQSRLALHIEPLYQQCWWHLAKQQDGSFVSQIRLDVEAANLTDRPVRLIKLRLIRPRMTGEILHAEASLPLAGSPYHSNRHPVPPHDTVTTALHIMVRGTLTTAGKSAKVTLGITDQFGDEYCLKGIVIRTHDPEPPKSTWTERLTCRVKGLALIGRGSDAVPLPVEWKHDGTFR
jgi:hypothetical protein